MRNLIPNGDLSAGVVAPWDSRLILDTEDKPAGLPASLRTLPGQLRIGVVNGSASVFDVVPGGKYHFEVWVKADKPDSRFRLELRGNSASSIYAGVVSPADDGGAYGGAGGLPIGNLAVPTEWTRYSAIITMRADTTRAWIGSAYFNYSYGAERGAVQWIAGAKLSPITDAYPIYTPGPAMLVEAAQLNLSAVTARVERIVGTSTEGIDDAIRNGVARAAQTIRHIDWFEVESVRGNIRDGEIDHFQVSMKVGFRLEDV